MNFTDCVGSSKVSALLNDRYEKTAVKVRSLLHESRRVTICLDGWSKKGLTSSFWGKSACFFDPNANISRHTMLSLVQLHHPHTGEALADALEKCLMHWDIPVGKVLLVICDNGANIVKAVRLMSARAEEQVEQRNWNFKIIDMMKMQTQRMMMMNMKQTRKMMTCL